MLELIQYVTSGFWVFLGSTIFITLGLVSLGWCINAILIGFRGVKAAPGDILDKL